MSKWSRVLSYERGEKARVAKRRGRVNIRSIWILKLDCGHEREYEMYHRSAPPEKVKCDQLGCAPKQCIVCGGTVYDIDDVRMHLSAHGD